MKEYFKGIKSKTAEATKNPGAVFGMLISICFSCWFGNWDLLCSKFG